MSKQPDWDNDYSEAGAPAVSAQRSRGLSSRDVAGVFFRRWRLIAAVSSICFLGAALGLLVRGERFESRMKILVTHDRVDPAITTEPNAARMAPSGVVTEEDINSEVALLKSSDLLKVVVERCRLDSAPTGWNPLRRYQADDPERREAKAVVALAKDLKVEPVRKSNLIEAKYAARNADTSAKVLQTLAELYLSKHLEVYRPHGEYDFFNHQAEEYKQALGVAQAQLAAFSATGKSVAPQAERDLLLQKGVDAEASREQTLAAEAGTTDRIRKLEEQLASTPKRLNTQSKIADNGQLFEKLKSRLLDLQLRKTELAANFAPTYRPLQEVEAQIAETQEMLKAETGKPITESTTDENPTYEWLSTELAKARSELAALSATESSMADAVRNYRRKMASLEFRGYQQQDLERTVKAVEQNYLMYLQKREEARITDALDERKISNVAIAESPIKAVLPVHDAGTMLCIAGLVSIVLGLFAAFLAEQTDSSVRTPQQLAQALDIPVLAAIPQNGHAQESHLPYLM